MKNATAVLAGLLILGVALAPTGASEEIEGTYAISATPVLSVTACPGVAVDDLLGDPIVDFCTGGFIFQVGNYPEGKVPVEATFADASGGAVDFTVCQNWGGDFCGEEGEPRVSGCGTVADLAGDSEVGFTNEHPTAAFVRLWDPDCPDTVATSGTITLRFA